MQSERGESNVHTHTHTHPPSQALVKKYGPEPVEEGGKSYEERMVAMFKRYNPEKVCLSPRQHIP